MDMMVSVRLSVSPFIVFYDMQERGSKCILFPRRGPAPTQGTYPKCYRLYLIRTRRVYNSHTMQEMPLQSAK